MGGNFLQSEFWGKFKEKFGWKVFNSHEPHEKHEQSLQILYRRLPFHIGMAYIPWGEIEPDDIVRVLNEIRGFLPKDTTFVRYDPPELKETYSLLLSTSYFLKKAPADVQPPDTVILDLRPSEEDILKQMKPKGRYNIRLAGRHGVQVRDAVPAELPVFYSLFTETCKRDGIAQHSLEYYQTLFDIFTPEISSSPSPPPFAGGVGGGVHLYIASHEGEDLAAIIVLHYGDTATYLYGASSNHKRNLMAPYALQWHAISHAKTAGCTEYDMFGIPPTDDPNHPMHGLYQFKTNFGGTIIHRPGSWDYVYKPIVYNLFRLAESLRKKLRDLKKR